MYQLNPVPRPNYPALLLLIGGATVFGLWVANKHSGG